MSFFQTSKRTACALAILGISGLTFITGCHSGGGGSTTYGTTGSRYSEPSGGGAQVAEERPGAGVGAQTSMGAAADVPEATQKGAGASNLTKPNESENSRAQAGAMGGSSEVGAGQTQGAAAGGAAITDATTLTGAQDPSSLAGRQARLSGLKVQQVLDQHLIQVSDSSGKPFYVHVNQPVQDLKPGDTVSLSGTVNRVPSDTTNLGLSDQASQVLQDQSIYLDAQQLQVTSH